MGFTFSSTLIFLIILSAVCSATLALAVPLFLKVRKTHSRSSLLALLIMLVEVIGMIGMIKDSIKGEEISQIFHTILAPGPIVGGFSAFFLLMMYIIELKMPRWLTFKRVIFALSPVLVLGVAMILLSGHYTQLDSISDIPANIYKIDVIVRLLMLEMYIVYAIAVCMAPYEWKECVVSKSVLYAIQTMLVIASFSFTVTFGLYIYIAMHIHVFLMIVTDGYIAYIELAHRLPIVEREVKEEQPRTEEIKKDFDLPEIWMNPEMTVSTLAKIMGTNQKYLLEEIKSQGYTGYNDMINRKRVKYICEKLKENNGKDIVQLMFDAGFRSRSTASSEFKRIMGCSPTEYLK